MASTGEGEYTTALSFADALRSAAVCGFDAGRRQVRPSAEKDCGDRADARQGVEPAQWGELHGGLRLHGCNFAHDSRGIA